MASGGRRSFFGAFIGTGASLTISKIGFHPSRVDLVNVDDPGFGTHVEGMPAASMAKQVDATSSFVTSNGITLNDAGFILGADTDLNVDGEQVFFTAME